MLILAFALCAASGYMAVASIWPDEKPTALARMIRICLAPGFGLGVFSVVFWLMRLSGDAHVVAVDLLLLILLGLAYAVQRSRANKQALSLSSRAQSRDLVFASESSDINAPKWIARLLTASFAIAAIAATYHATFRIIAHPHGDGWDAFAIWNLHARFLFLGGTHWRDGFNSLIPWSHPDYPVLLPAAIAHVWSYLGHDDPVVPAIVGLIFTFSTFALLVSSLASLRGRNAAMLGGLALSSTPFFVEQGTSQYADVPVSFFILGSLVLLYIAERTPSKSERLRTMTLSGLAAGFAAWTKNEGLLFLCALLVTQFWFVISNSRRKNPSRESAGNWRLLASFVLGTAPVLAVVVLFKHTIAIPGDLFSTPASMIHKMLTPTRYWIILQWFAKESLRFGNWWIIPGTVAMIAFYVLSFRTRKSQRSLHISTLTILLTLAGYFAIYVITPRDLYWHLRFSLSRLFLQLWPGVIFLFFWFVARQRGPASQIESEVAQNGKL